MGIRTLVKVYSHQLTMQFSLSKEGSKPAPNLLIVLMNEFANVIVELAMHEKLGDQQRHTAGQIKVPPFMPKVNVFQ